MTCVLGTAQPDECVVSTSHSLLFGPFLDRGSAGARLGGPKSAWVLAYRLILTALIFASVLLSFSSGSGRKATLAVAVVLAVLQTAQNHSASCHGLEQHLLHDLPVAMLPNSSVRTAQETGLP